MRIVHIIDYLQPQLGYQEFYLAREQTRLGHDVTVITSDRYAPFLYSDSAATSFLGSRRRVAGCHDEDGILVHRLPTRWEVSSRVWMDGLQKKLRDLRPDAIHVHNVLTLSTARTALAHRWVGSLKSSVLLIDDHLYPQASTSRLRPLYPLLRRTLFPVVRRSADWLIAVSTATRDFMRDSYGFPEQEIEIVPLGVDQQLFRPDSIRRRQIRQELGVGDNDALCIYTGKIVPHKQVDVLIKAVASLGNDYSRLRLLILGYSSRDYLAKLRALVVELGMADRVIWREAAPQEQLAAYFASADIAVWPSGHSISFLEAMSCGIPIVVSDEPKSAEDTRHQNGLTYATGSHLDLAARLRLLVESAGLRQRMGLAGRRTVEACYTWTAISKRFVEYYSQPRKATSFS